MGKRLLNQDNPYYKPAVVEILDNQNGTFAMLKAGELLRASIPDRGLEAEMARFGICGEEHRDMRRLLDGSGKAQFTVYTLY